MSTVLLAGATGYLGRFIAQELFSRGMPARLLTRDLSRVAGLDRGIAEIVHAEVTRRDTLRGTMEGVDVVVSTVGITRQQDGLTYMDVDYGANRNLLEEALGAGVRRFVYVSVLHGETMRDLAICEAKERFVADLKASGMSYTVLRPSGFFNDLAALVRMARRGRVYVFGDGSVRANPIHGADLAAVCVDALEGDVPVIEVGGPDVLTQRDMAYLAFEALGRPPKITHIPPSVRRTALAMVRTCTPGRVHGPLAFFLTVAARDMVAPEAGFRRLRDYYRQIADRPPAAS
ncbi:MAG: SDR family oxidoreductase [Bacteroidetes bacterium]|nr:MAG: SDR family oxidoreductase [Bacteroidota bacterium]